MIPRRKPVASPEILATPEGAAIAGWQELTIELSAGSAGFRADGTFRGTRWRTVGLKTADGEEPQLESMPPPPRATDVTGLKALVAEVLRHRPPRRSA